MLSLNSLYYSMLNGGISKLNRENAGLTVLNILLIFNKRDSTFIKNLL